MSEACTPQLRLQRNSADYETQFVARLHGRRRRAIFGRVAREPKLEYTVQYSTVVHTPYKHAEPAA